MTFLDMLGVAERQNNSMLCVGLDPEPARFPGKLKDEASRIYDFCAAIVDSVADLVSAFKPQIAYFAAHRAEGQLERLIAHMRRVAPQVPIILDAKRGDIGSTAAMYAIEAFDRYGADAVTLNPYMGHDSVQPFLERADKGCIFLCHTSNPGAADFQELEFGGGALYQCVAEAVAHDWNANGNCALVVGATFPEELVKIRGVVGDMPLLIPGIGAQGGDVESTVRNGKTADGTGLMINSSRGILFASNGPDYSSAAARAAQTLRD
ncbi:MAG: orotidine-5'-phosphate decarboxylase, partial [Polaromonas sp.]